MTDNPSVGKVEQAFEGNEKPLRHLQLAACLIFQDSPGAPNTPDMIKWANTAQMNTEITRRQMRGFRERCESLFEEMEESGELTAFVKELLAEAATIPSPLVLPSGKKNSAGRGGGIFEGDETLNERLDGESGAGANSLKNDYNYDPITGEGEFEVDLTDDMIREMRIRRLASQEGFTDAEGNETLDSEALITLEKIYGLPNYQDVPLTPEDLMGLVGFPKEFEVGVMDISRGATWLRDYPGEDAYTRNVTRVKGKLINKSRIAALALHQAAPINLIVKEYSEPAFAKPKSGKRVIAVTPDPQVGYRREPHTGKVVTTHDERAINVAAKVIRAIQPDLSVNVGDYLDFAEFSRFDSESGMALVTQAAIDRGAQVARVLNLKVIMEGNHDKRILTHLMATNSALFGIGKARLNAEEMLEQNPLISLSNLMRLDEIGCEFIEGYPSNVYRLHERLVMIHGTVINSAGSSAAKMLKGEPATDCVLFGHIHSREFHELSGGRDAASAVNRWAASDGTLARIDGRVSSTKGAYTSSGKIVDAYENWQQGMSIVTVDDNDPTATPIHEPIPIRNGVAYFRGEEFLWDEEEVREQLTWMKDVGFNKVDIGDGIFV